MPSIDTLPVLLTKIQPPARRPDSLRRSRLLDALLEHVDRKLLLVIAPAGYGKTTLLADLVDYAPMPVAWLALDGGDRDPRGFVEYLVHALRRQFAGFGGATLAALDSGTEIEQSVTALARAFAADVQQHVPQVSLLVLDDFHEVNESKTVTAFLDEALRLLPDNLRIALAGRSLPRLTISRLAVGDQLFGLGEADLRFDADEVEELIRVRYGVELPRERAEQLTERAEGWITGVLLSTRGIWDGVLDRLVHAEGLQGALYGYLEDEAFTRHPHQLREFLLASSVLAVVDPASCEALLGPGDWLDLLQQAEQASLFITRLGGPQIAFRYHQLFRDFLEARLRRHRPEQFRALHARAARHRAAEKDWAAAIHHARAAGDDGELALLLERIAPDLEREGRWFLLAEAIDGLPPDLREGNARLLLARARAAALTGDHQRAESLARRALSLAQGPHASSTRAWVLQVLGNTLRRLGRIDEAVEALTGARELDVADDDLAATLRSELAGCYGVRGDFAAAGAELRAALAYFEQTGNTYEAARAAFGLGTAHGRTGDAEGAAGHYRSALAGFRAAGDRGNTALTLNNLGYLLLLQGSYDQAETILAEALTLARDAGYPSAQAQALDSLATLCLHRGRLDRATDLFREGLVVAETAGERWSMTAVAEGLAYCALFRDEPTAAERWLDRAAALAEEQGSAYRAALIALARGVLSLHSGDVERALASCTAAEDRFAQAGVRRDVVRARAWLAQVHWRRRDVSAAGECFHQAAREAVALHLPALLDLPARWDLAAFSALPPGDCRDARDAVLLRVGNGASPAQVAAPLGEPVSGPRLAVYSFGGARVLDPRGDELDWPREKGRELFFYLLHNGASRSDRLHAGLWPNASPGQAKAGLYAATYALRRALGADVLRVTGQTYQLNGDAIAFHDAGEFDVLDARLHREFDPERRVAALERIVRLYGGPLLDGLHAEWLEEHRRAYEVRYAEALRSLVAARAERGAWRTCLAAALDGLKADPYCESFYAYATRSYIALGDRDAARRTFREGRRRLAEIFGV